MEDRVRDLESRNRQLERDLSEVVKMNAVIGSEMRNIDKRLSDIEDTLRWIVRLTVGTPLLAAIAFFIRGGFSP